MIYGDTPNNGLADAQTKQLNLRAKPYKHHDTAGIVISMGRNPASGADEAFDFKGNLLRSRRQLSQNYKTISDWSANPGLEQETFTSSTNYDALNRPVSVTAPDNSVYRPTFNEFNLLEKVDFNLRGAAVATPFVTGINYDAKGQRVLIDYGNGVSTSYEYDPLTFRLVHLLTRRNAVDFPDDCPQPPPVGWPDCQLQNLHYTYDPSATSPESAMTLNKPSSTTGKESSRPPTTSTTRFTG